MHAHYRPFLALSLLLLLMVTGCVTTITEDMVTDDMVAEQAAPPATPIPVTIAVGAPHVPVYLNFDLAQALGYFADEGLAVDLHFFDGGSDAAAALMRGEADFSGNAMDHVLEAQMAGTELRMLMNFLDQPCATFVVRADLAEEIQSPADFAGRTVGVTRFGSATHTLTLYLADRAGIGQEEFTAVEVGAAGMEDALRGQQVDAAMGVAPFTTHAVDAGEAVTLLDLCQPEITQSALGGGWPFTGLLTRAEALTEDEATAQRVVNALVKAQHFITTHSAAEIVALLPDEVVGDDAETYRAALDATLPAFSQMGGTIDPAGLDRLLELHRVFGTITDDTVVAVDDLYNNTLVERALKETK